MLLKTPLPLKFPLTLFVKAHLHSQAILIWIMQFVALSKYQICNCKASSDIVTVTIVVTVLQSFQTSLQYCIWHHWLKSLLFCTSLSCDFHPTFISSSNMKKLHWKLWTSKIDQGCKWVLVDVWLTIFQKKNTWYKPKGPFNWDAVLI